jgi:hypothetical protein
MNLPVSLITETIIPKMEYKFVLGGVLIVMQFGISPGMGEGITEKLDQ